MAARDDARPGAAGGAQPIRAGGGGDRSSAASPGPSASACVPQPPATRTEHEGDRAHPGRPVRQPDRGQGEAARRPPAPGPAPGAHPGSPPPTPRAGPRGEGSREAVRAEPHPEPHSPLRSLEEKDGLALAAGCRDAGSSPLPFPPLPFLCPYRAYLGPAGAQRRSASTLHPPAAAGAGWGGGAGWAWPSSLGSQCSLGRDGWGGQVWVGLLPKP